MAEDAFVLLSQVTKGAMRVFLELKSNRNIQNNLTMTNPTVGLTRTQKETHSRRLKELLAVGLIRKAKGKRFPRNTYILHPKHVACFDLKAAITYWDEHKVKEVTNGL